MSLWTFVYIQVVLAVIAIACLVLTFADRRWILVSLFCVAASAVNVSAQYLVYRRRRR